MIIQLYMYYVLLTVINMYRFIHPPTFAPTYNPYLPMNLHTPIHLSIYLSVWDGKCPEVQS